VNKVDVDGRSDGMPHADREQNRESAGAEQESAEAAERSVCTGMTAADVKVKQVRASSLRTLHIHFVYVETARSSPLLGTGGQ
jgi:hypothetical protein